MSFLDTLKQGHVLSGNGLYEIPSANPVYIDSVYNNLTENIKNSFYGKKLGEIIAERSSK